MKPAPLADLYCHITSFASLHGAARRAQKGKRYRPAVLSFNARLEQNLFTLQDELQSFTYSPGPYRQFEIFEPKRRLISAAPYRDRVVHHALCAAIVPCSGTLWLLDRILANGSCVVGFHVLPGRERVRNHNLLKGRRRRLFRDLPFAVDLPR